MGLPPRGGGVPQSIVLIDLLFLKLGTEVMSTQNHFGELVDVRK